MLHHSDGCESVWDMGVGMQQEKTSWRARTFWKQTGFLLWKGLQQQGSQQEGQNEVVQMEDGVWKMGFVKWVL